MQATCKGDGIIHNCYQINPGGSTTPGLLSKAG